MDEPRAAATPSRRWWRSRKVAFLMVLLAGCTIAFFAWDTLFMPADLRGMQGAWKVVRVLEEGKDESLPLERIVFSGRSVAVVNKDGVIERSMPLEIDSNRRLIFLYQPRETTILGMTIQLPLWLKRTPEVAKIEYELTAQLVLHHPLDEKGLRNCDIFLERE